MWCGEWNRVSSGRGDPRLEGRGAAGQLSLRLDDRRARRCTTSSGVATDLDGIRENGGQESTTAAAQVALQGAEPVFHPVFGQ